MMHSCHRSRRGDDGIATDLTFVPRRMARSAAVRRLAGWRPDGATMDWETSDATLPEVRYRIQLTAT
jgi:hypothetical protein